MRGRKLPVGKTAGELLGFEYDWLGSDLDGQVALFTTAGAALVAAPLVAAPLDALPPSVRGVALRTKGTVRFAVQPADVYPRFLPA